MKEVRGIHEAFTSKPYEEVGDVNRIGRVAGSIMIHIVLFTRAVLNDV